MITQDMLINNFVDVESMPFGVFKFKDIVPSFSLIYYLKSGLHESRDLLLVAKNHDDDSLAAEMVQTFSDESSPSSSLRKCRLPKRTRHGFTHALFVPSRFHKFFKGRLDKERE